MRLRNKRTQLSSLPDKPSPRRKSVKIGTWLYFIIILGLLFYIGSFSLDRFFYIEGRGHIEIPKILVGAGYQGIIQSIHVKIQQHVVRNQQLAVLASIPQPKSAPKPPKIDAILKDIIKNEHELMRLQTRRDLMADRIEKMRMELKRNNKWRLMEQALEIRRSDNTAPIIDSNKLESLEYQLAEMNAAIDAQYDYIDRLETLIPEHEQISEAPSLETTLTAPVDGIVGGIFRNSSEYLGTKETVLSIIPDYARAEIKAYFNLKHIAHVKAGGPVTIILPDKRSVEGRIDETYSVARQFKEADREDYIPIEPMLEVSIIPSGSVDDNIWKLFDEMEITIKVRREWTNFNF